MTVVEPDVELCHPTEGPIWAYYGQRAVTRKSTKGEPRHAVAAWSKLGGALDAECGVIAAPEHMLGPWDPKDPSNCKKCAKFLAGEMPMPPDPVIPDAEGPAVPAEDVEGPVPLHLAFSVAA